MAAQTASATSTCDARRRSRIPMPSQAFSTVRSAAQSSRPASRQSRIPRPLSRASARSSSSPAADAAASTDQIPLASLAPCRQGLSNAGAAVGAGVPTASETTVACSPNLHTSIRAIRRKSSAGRPSSARGRTQSRDDADDKAARSSSQTTRISRELTIACSPELLTKTRRVRRSSSLCSSDESRPTSAQIPFPALRSVSTSSVSSTTTTLVSSRSPSPAPPTQIFSAAPPTLSRSNGNRVRSTAEDGSPFSGPDYRSKVKPVPSFDATPVRKALRRRALKPALSRTLSRETSLPFLFDMASQDPPSPMVALDELSPVRSPKRSFDEVETEAEDELDMFASPIRKRPALGRAMARVFGSPADSESAFGSRTSFGRKLVRSGCDFLCAATCMRPRSPEPVPAQEVVKAPSMIVEEMLKAKQETRLPCFRIEEHDPVPRISQETLCRVMDGEFDAVYSKKVIVDCRFDYEFQGGHIDGAINVTDPEALAERLFRECDETTLVVVHCEFSQLRGPRMASFIRARDREINGCRYPHLSLPDLYILDEGYCSFYQKERARCEPRAYVPMDSKAYMKVCDKEMDKVRGSRVRKASTLVKAGLKSFGRGLGKLNFK